FMLARVLRILARTGSHDFTLLMADTAAAICEAEVLQFQLAENEEYSLDSYTRVIEGKTATLISAALEGVAILAGSDGGRRDARREFGMSYGRAFQMRDDYLDLLSDSRML